MNLEGKRIGLALTGSFCTLAQVLEEAKALRAAGAELYPIFSENVQILDTKFGPASYWREAFGTVCEHEMITDIVQAEPIGPKSYLDLMLIAPCTGNTLAKLTQGITDSAVLMATKAHLRNDKPVVLAVATNDGLSRNLKNIAAMLAEKNIYLVPFGQDDPIKKPFSLVAKMPLIIDTVSNALEGRQLQPILR